MGVPSLAASDPETAPSSPIVPETTSRSLPAKALPVSTPSFPVPWNSIVPCCPPGAVQETVAIRSLAEHTGVEPATYRTAATPVMKPHLRATNRWSIGTLLDRAAAPATDGMQQMAPMNFAMEFDDLAERRCRLLAEGQLTIEG